MVLMPAADLLSVSPTSHIAISDGICGGGATGLLCMKTRHGGIDAIAHIRLHLYWMSDLRDIAALNRASWTSGPSGMEAALAGT